MTPLYSFVNSWTLAYYFLYTLHVACTCMIVAYTFLYTLACILLHTLVFPCTLLSTLVYFYTFLYIHNNYMYCLPFKCICRLHTLACILLHTLGHPCILLCTIVRFQHVSWSGAAEGHVYGAQACSGCHGVSGGTFPDPHSEQHHPCWLPCAEKGGCGHAVQDS